MIYYSFSVWKYCELLRLSASLVYLRIEFIALLLRLCVGRSCTVLLDHHFLKFLTRYLVARLLAALFPFRLFGSIGVTTGMDTHLKGDSRAFHSKLGLRFHLFYSALFGILRGQFVTCLFCGKSGGQ